MKSIACIEKLLTIASEPLAGEPIFTVNFDLSFQKQIDAGLRNLLIRKNGFYAFEGALHVFSLPDGKLIDPCLNLTEWNHADIWRTKYGDILNGITFFAEDIFGVQFGMIKNGVASFDPETAEIVPVADSLEDWACLLLSEYPTLTGYPIAHSWQQGNGPIPVGKRLLPKVPFVLGGKFEIENLVAVNAVEGMLYRADIWRQIRNLPDGAQVRLNALPLH